MLRVAVIALCSALAALPVAARPLGDVVASRVPTHRERICAHIEAAAAQHDLPVAFLTRLIWRESSFRPRAVSPRGAQGIAQFMPGTAAERGLADPFEPEAAIDAAASFLTDLRGEFGNLGLAAAAYNGGPNRVAGWLAGTSGLPFETQRFVSFITGRSAGDWRGSAETGPVADTHESAQPVRCATVLAALARPARIVAPVGPAPTAPWGAQVAGHFSKDRALAIYAGLQDRYRDVLAGRPPMVVGTRNRSRGSAVFFAVRVPAQTQEDANAVCTRLKKAGAGCIVQKS